MNIKARTETVDIAILNLEGRLDVVAAPQVRDLGKAKISEGVTRFIFDLSEITFLDSAGLASLVNVLKNARREGGNVRLIMPTLETARRTIVLTKFDQVFDVFEDEAAALSF